jgi:hypothetical protein
LLKSKRFKIFYYEDGLAVIANRLKRVRVVVDIVETWCKMNLMEININKCGFKILAWKKQLTMKKILFKTIGGLPFV